MIQDLTRRSRKAFHALKNCSAQDRSRILKALAKQLVASRDAIKKHNNLDVARAKSSGLSSALQDRLIIDEPKLHALEVGLDQLAAMDDLLDTIGLARELDAGLELYRVACPIGVIGVVFEARPDALVQIVGLCLKTGNAVILKGGSEAQFTNRFLVELIQDVLVAEGFPREAVQAIESREDLRSILALHEDIDLLIPRGSNEFVRYCMENSLIPVLGHADGICHIYLHNEANLNRALPILLDAKTQATGVCNAMETLLIDVAWSQEDLAHIIEALQRVHVQIFADRELAVMFDLPIVEDWHHEYLSFGLSVKLVDGLDEAIEHINRYGSGHTDAILTEDRNAAEQFMKKVDSANVYHNCSTRFSDGFRYGFGAEVGVSTAKIHARGPVGPEGLLSYQYRLYGSGQTVAPYAEGIKKFTHRDLSDRLH